MQKVTVIVPLCDLALSPGRTEAYAAVRTQLEAAGLDVYEAHQIRALDGVHNGTRDIQKKQLLWYKSGPFRKAALVNTAAKVLAARAEPPDWIWIHDADILLPFSKILEQLPPDASAVKPFRKILRLDRKQTEDKLAGRQVEVPVKSTKVCVEFGGGSFLVKLSAFLWLRGFDQRFYGWGGEDIEFGERASQFYPVDTITERGVHLWHQPVPKSETYTHTKRNRKLLTELRKQLQQDPYAHLTNMDSGIPTRDRPLYVGQPPVLIQTYSYEDEQRHKATKAALNCGGALDPAPRRVFVELVDPARGESPDIRKIIEDAGGTYHSLEMKPEHKYVFHKEDLWNYAVRNLVAENETILLFLDADSYPEDRDWANRTALMVATGGDDTVWQPWSEFIDTKDKDIGGLSMAWQVNKHGDWQHGTYPGLALAMTKACWESIGGFPTSCPAGAGDTMLMVELSGKQFRVPYMKDFPYFEKAVRAIPEKKLRPVPAKMIHVYHGTFASRVYYLRHRLLQEFWPWDSDVWSDENGLICIRDGSALQYCMKHRREVKDGDEAYKLLKRSGLDTPITVDLHAFLKAKEEDPEYMTGRWGYYKAAGEMLKETGARGQFLEVGPRKLPLVMNADYMDLWGGGVESVIHDAGEAPWPYPDKAFAAVVALQVLEHLKTDEDKEVFFQEAARVADHVLVSVPWAWVDGEESHRYIDAAEMNRWSNAAWVKSHIDETLPTKKRLVALYKADDIINGTRVPICIEPWFNLRIWANRSLTCCFLPGGVTYPRFQGGPYSGDVVWNSQPFKVQRRNMLASGRDALCPNNTYCTVRGLNLDVAGQVQAYKTRYGGDERRWKAVQDAVEKGKTDAPFPLVVHAVIGDVCNAACPMCSQSYLENKVTIGDPEIRQLQRLCRQAAYVHLSGGDLFALSDDQIDRLLTIIPYGAVGATTTNGIGLTLERYEKYVIGGPIRRISVSIDTIDPAMYLLQRGCSIEPLRANLEAIVGVHELHNIDLASAAVNAWTLPGLPALLDYVESVNIDELGITDTFGTCVPEAVRITGDNMLTQEQVIQFRAADAALSSSIAVHVTGWAVVRDLLEQRCPA